MTADFAKTVDAVGIGSSLWLERPVQILNKIKASVGLKINQNTSLQETAFLSYSNHRRASNPTKKKQNMKATIEQIADRANQLSGSMSHGQACYAACREMGVEESEVVLTSSIVSTVLTNREINVGGPARVATERETLKLRGQDRIEGSEIVLVFKRGREVRMARTEWEKLVATKNEPHAIAALRLNNMEAK